MACPEATWLSPNFSTDGDPAVQESARPDQTQW